MQVSPRKSALAALALVVFWLLPGVALAQESPTTFFGREAWDTCSALTAAAELEAVAGAVKGAAWQPRTAALAAYFAWAEGYLTARAEDGSMQRQAWRANRAAPAMRYLVSFCADHPVQTYYAAVAALADMMSGRVPGRLTPD